MGNFYRENKKKINAGIIGLVSLVLTGIINLAFDCLKTKDDSSKSITNTNNGNNSINAGTINGNVNFTTIYADTLSEVKPARKENKRPKDVQKKQLPVVEKQNSSENLPINITQQNTGGQNTQNISFNQNVYKKSPISAKAVSWKRNIKTNKTLARGRPISKIIYNDSIYYNEIAFYLYSVPSNSLDFIPLIDSVYYFDVHASGAFTIYNVTYGDRFKGLRYNGVAPGYYTIFLNTKDSIKDLHSILLIDGNR